MNRTNTQRPDYQSYMLRLWREGAHTPWRASLQSTADEQIVHFGTLEALFDFLNSRLDDNGTARSTPTLPSE